MRSPRAIRVDFSRAYAYERRQRRYHTLPDAPGVATTCRVRVDFRMTRLAKERLLGTRWVVKGHEENPYRVDRIDIDGHLQLVSGSTGYTRIHCTIHGPQFSHVWSRVR